MKKILLFIALFPVFALGQSTDQNYVHTITIKDTISSGVPPSEQITYFDGLGRPIEQIAHKQSPLGNDVVTHMEYDSIGRQKKEYLPIVSGQTLDYHNISEANVLSFYNDQSNVNETTANPFSQKEFENSPLNRVLKQAAPGNTWTMGGGHEVRLDYQANDESDAVILLKAETSWTSGYEPYEPTLNQTENVYPSGQLYKTITKDENWSDSQSDQRLNTTEEYKDKEGHVVLKRTYNVVHDSVSNSDSVINHDTYYVYDEYGNLTYVIPPLASSCGCSFASVLDDLCYQYKYDSRNRLVEKKLPGKQWEFTAYNNQDKPIATGPVPSPWGIEDSWGWLITKYDAFDRVIYTGWLQAEVTGTKRIAFQTALESQVWAEHYIASPTTIDGVQVSYSNDNDPREFKLLTVNYYDTYVHAFGPTTIPTTVLDQSVKHNMKGLATGSWVRVLTGPDQTLAEKTDIFYDYKGRQVESHKINYIGGYTIVDSKLDFTGKTLISLTFHKRTTSATELKIKDFFEYSEQDRLLLHKQQINDEPMQLIAKNEYNEQGQLTTKQVGGTDLVNYRGLQKVDYLYNIRGWLTNINDVSVLQEDTTIAPKDLFAFKINYDKVDNTVDGEVSPLYNGNIAETYWRTSSDNIMRKYGYKYDNLNRLQKAIYQKPNSTYPVTNMYNEELVYDMNGNIQHLKRNGDLDDPEASSVVQIDDLKYTYDDNKKNQLKEVTDSSTHPKGFTDDDNATNDTDYGYDDNGNLTSDLNKKIDKIRYNHLNLPTYIKFLVIGNIEYLYDATGQKVMKTVTDGTTVTQTDYLDGFQYTDSVLNFFPHAEGYVNVTYCAECAEGEKLKFDYVYHYVDHLGNVRVSYGLDRGTQELKILEENHYYPFGLKHTRYNSIRKQYDMDPFGTHTTINTTTDGLLNKYKFQGQERQDELGLNWDSFKWRNYDYAIGRFMSIDPLAEDYTHNSPYAFAENKVISFRELEGLEGVSVNPTQQWNGAFRQATQELVGAFDGFSAKVSAFFTSGEEVAPNVSVETTTTASAGTNFLNYLNAKQFDQSTLVQPFTAKVETKTEIKASVKVTANAEGLDVTIKNTTSVSADGTKKNETKAVVGVGENGAFVSKATTNKGGKTTSAVRAGVQVEAKAQTGAHTYIKVGASFSAGQRQ